MRRSNGRIEEVHVIQDPASPDGVMITEMTGEGVGEGGDLRSQLPFGQLGELRRSRWPAMRASTIARPDWVRTLEATEVSLMPAS